MVNILFCMCLRILSRLQVFRCHSEKAVCWMSADTHRLHHVSGLAWIDEHTVVTTSHDASIKQWTIKYWAASREIICNSRDRDYCRLQSFFSKTVFSLSKWRFMLSVNIWSVKALIKLPEMFHFDAFLTPLMHKKVL